MFGLSLSHGANVYAKVGIETGVVAASPHQLIVMLFEGAIVAINKAMQGLESGDIPAKGQSISKAIAIIDTGLRASLDKRVGGEIALNLDALYEYMSQQLVLANLNNDSKILLDVQILLKDLKDAWEKIAPNNSIQNTLEPASLDPLQPRTTHVFEA